MLTRSELKNVIGGWGSGETSTCHIACPDTPNISFTSSSPCYSDADCRYSLVDIKYYCTLYVFSGDGVEASCDYSYTPTYDI